MRAAVMCVFGLAALLVVGLGTALIRGGHTSASSIPVAHSASSLPSATLRRAKASRLKPSLKPEWTIFRLFS